MNSEPRVIFESFSAEKHPVSYSFSGFREIISASTLDDVIPALLRVEEAVNGGLHAAGFMSYEASPALGQVLVTHPPSDFPLVWFAIYERRFPVTPPELGAPTGTRYETAAWCHSAGVTEHGDAVERIREYIAAGDTYQVNLTLRHRFRFSGDPHAFYRDLCRSQTAPFCAYIDTGRFQVLSASPELFFELRRGTVTACPMKGTMKRGRWHAEDDEIKESLRTSRKERAENLMIVDLLRNDIGKITIPGSVKVPALFEVETLETVHQMTSTISGRMRENVGLVELFRALFPCGSITGAPKRRAMEIIAELEDSPRGIYTGCIGLISPRQECVFSVAIRTVVIDSATGQGELGTGGGITWDSAPVAEFDECLVKARFATEPRPEFQLVETLLHEEEEGFFLLERHMARLFRSAAYFGYTLRLGTVLDTLNLRAQSLRGRNLVRLLVSRSGTFTVRTEAIAPPAEGDVAIVKLAEHPVDSHHTFLYHKTTHRPRYEAEFARHQPCTDVIFANERGEITEGTRTNIVVGINGKLVTPPLSAGLLPGTFREELLSSQVIKERPVTIQELRQAQDLFLINSVRKWRKARLV